MSETASLKVYAYWDGYNAALNDEPNRPKPAYSYEEAEAYSEGYAEAVADLKD